MSASGVLGCDNGHRFDANRRGYLTAIDPAAGIAGDPRQILEARARFLQRGHYQPIMDAVAASIDHPRSRPLEIVDAGSGTGHYLAHLLSRGPDRRGLALDASSVAVAMSVATAHSPGLVADTWKLLPVRTDRADAILCVFAPRNASEFARILRPTGSLVVVTPGPRHLTELRESGVVIGMQENKQDALARGLGEHFQCTDRTALEYSVHISAEDGDDLASMGPSGHHERSGAWIGGSVSVDVDVTIWALREPS